MPKTLTLDVPAQRLVREALMAKRQLISRSLDGKRHRWAVEQLAILDAVLAELNKPVMVQVRNLMTGELVWEAEDTPWHCSVQSESYWSA